MLTIYNVSCHDDELIRVNDSPYGVLPCASYRRFTGIAFLKRGSRALSVFRVGEQASVDCVQLDTSFSEDVEITAAVSVEESDAVNQLVDMVGNTKTDADIFGDQGKVVTDLFPAYDRKHEKFEKHSLLLTAGKIFFEFMQSNRRRQKKNKQRGSMT